MYLLIVAAAAIVGAMRKCSPLAGLKAVGLWHRRRLWRRYERGRGRVLARRRMVNAALGFLLAVLMRFANVGHGQGPFGRHALHVLLLSTKKLYFIFFYLDNHFQSSIDSTKESNIIMMALFSFSTHIIIIIILRRNPLKSSI